MSINRNFFFLQVTQNLFSGKLRSSQIVGLSAILDEWEANHADQDDRWLAYMLATAHHETDRQIQELRSLEKAKAVLMAVK